MQTILLTIVVFLLAFLALCTGVMLGRPPLRGSCGGLSCLKGIECGACPRRGGG